ncbi:MAG: FAD-dependent thymidylate synthase [Nanoarchaeota archaeon]|nr:FAD-dependent thymidylate synthase [Nanoarchaeota archaeon]
MEIKLKRSTGEYTSIPEFLKFSQTCARQCYSEKDFDELEKEPFNTNNLIDRTLNSGHHSVHEHGHLTFYMKGIPKALAMVFNNEKQYVTSEKSARYTQMKDVKSEQKEKYDKWMTIFERRTREEYPESKYARLYVKDDTGKTPAQKLAQENARYVTSVFTPTKMIHTVNLRQLNFLIYEFEDFIDKFKNGKDLFKSQLADSMIEFLGQVKSFKIEGLKNQTDRHLSFFGNPVEEHFGDVYSTNYLMSLACLAQAHRHRTINYQVAEDIKLGASHGFHVPKIIRNTGLGNEWISDLRYVAGYDFPQAQLISITERGIREDFRSKLILRLCGHAQHEIMERTLSVAKNYAEKDIDKEWLKPKCLQGMQCNSKCIWGGKKALERLI